MWDGRLMHCVYRLEMVSQGQLGKMRSSPEVRMVNLYVRVSGQRASNTELSLSSGTVPEVETIMII